jgi:hypothetical protein
MRGIFNGFLEFVQAPANYCELQASGLMMRAVESAVPSGEFDRFWQVR